MTPALNKYTDTMLNTPCTLSLNLCVTQMVRSEVDYTQQLCDTCSKELAREFKDWWVEGLQHGVS